ncbi:MAG: acetyl-CoA carboxylase, carboxyltransferase subunit beta [Magnetospiraceae bacterium]
MNWLTNFVRPKLRGLVAQKEVPENLWVKCGNCGQMIFHRDLDENHRVCQHCDHHMRLGAKGRLRMLFDDGEYTLAELPEIPNDPLKFKDRRRYTDRIKDAQTKTGEKDAIQVGLGKMDGMDVVVAAFDFGYMGGSMGIAVGEGLVIAARLAVAQDAPLIVVPSSGGARMQEGILSLMQMARSTVAVDEVREAGLPYITILTDPTTGGVSASFAMLGDIAIAEPGAVIGFAGARVIEQTIRETLPDGFQRAEYLLEHGMIDMVVPRPELRETLIRIIALLRKRGPAAEVVPLAAATDDAPEKVADTAPEIAPAPTDGDMMQQAAPPGTPDAAPGDFIGDPVPERPAE